MNIVNKILNSIGFSVVKTKHSVPFHMELKESISPVAFTYHQSGCNGVVVDVDLARGRAFPCFSFENDLNHPYVLAAKFGGFNEERTYQILKSYYTFVSPGNAAEVYNITLPTPVVSSSPSWAVVLPWESDNQEQWLERVRLSVRSENKGEGVRMNVERGWSWLGPTSNEKARLEAKRLISILKSVSKEGYQRKDSPDGDIIVNILLKNEHEWVWQARTGQHRAAVLGSLNFRNVPVRVMKFVRRDEVNYWPNVLNGLYTVNHALKIFDMIFENNFGHLTKGWDEFVSNEIKKKR